MRHASHVAINRREGNALCATAAFKGRHKSVIVGRVVHHKCDDLNKFETGIRFATIVSVAGDSLYR
jgi:hypothetical protein